MTGQRDVYVDGLARRTYPPDTYKGALERVQRRRIVVVGRMPTEYELRAWRARTERRAAVLMVIELAVMFMSGFVVGYLVYR